MVAPLVLPLAQCHDASLAGGKAVGLARVLKAGLKVPPGCCLTTCAYRTALEAVGFSPVERWRRAIQLQGDDRQRELEDCRQMILRADTTYLRHHLRQTLGEGTGGDQRWAVRSSATNEDMVRVRYAGLYRTELGLPWDEIGRGIAAVWISVWDARVIEYMMKSGTAEAPPAMAVIIQPMLDAALAGVAYSVDPVTGRSGVVTINAIRGLGAPLADGKVTPDQYTVETGPDQPARLIRYIPGHQVERLLLGSSGVTTESVRAEERNASALSEQQLAEVTALVNRVEQAFGGPVDVEWAFDHAGLWVLQSRPITALRSAADLTNEDSEWSRANFKETLPEVPSPMGLSFLEHFMDAYILSHYRRLGCRIPSDVSPVRTLSGRPYLNVSLFYALIGQLGGNPALLVEQMGGEPLQSPVRVQRLDWRSFLKAAFLMWQEMGRVLRWGPTWFAEMKALALLYSPDRVRSLALEEAEARLDELARWLPSREVTFGIAAGVGQCLQAFSRLLPGWLGRDWRGLLNAALQGLGTVISAQQILHLAELVELARADPAVSDRLGRGEWERGGYRRSFAGSQFLAGFDRYLGDYGHRGTGESDVMSPRMADQPEALLEVIRIQLAGPPTTPAAIAGRQRAAREEALASIKARCGLRVDRWLIFRWWYRRLCLFFALREANRHHLMWYSAAARNLLLHVGKLMTEQGLFRVPEDIFFLTLQERAAMPPERTKNWGALVKARRAQREQWLTLEVPDTIRSPEPPDLNDHLLEAHLMLSGIPVSSGRVSGPVTFVRSEADWINVRRGDIIVAPVIDPGMAPLFGVAAGLVVEMGGTLSHGAIIAREYGLPTITNVRRVMTQLSEGEIIIVDARQGIVTRQAAASGT
ncbi:MAG TPA: PEP/pyruvate-binding domain-containing protein [Nitrospira sp.]|nr:PEP/pyruvate-binding domain-containing protein [Nitrospira sp.]